MKNVKMINNIGDILLVLGSALYVYALMTMQTPVLTAIISAVYAVAVVLKAIYLFSTREERKAAKAAAKAAKGKAA